MEITCPWAPGLFTPLQSQPRNSRVSIKGCNQDPSGDGIETLWKIQEESSQFLLTFLLQQELVSQQKWQRSVSSRVGWHLGFHPVKPEGLRRAEVVLCAGDINILKIPAGTAIIKMAMFLPKPTVFSPKQCEKPQNICLPFQLGRQQVWSKKYSLDHTLPDLLRLPVFLFATSWICTN